LRIVSLLPSATEIVYALNLDEALVGITHECDYPPSVASKPVLIESVLGAAAYTLSAKDIDAKIRETVQKGEAVYRFKPDALKNAKPDLTITQGLCDVCAIPNHFVIKEIKSAKLDPQIISLDPEDVTGILTDIRRVGEITGKVDKAGEIVDALEERVGEVAGRTRSLTSAQRPKVAVIEWTEPPFAPGHWVPEMIDLAGGIDVFGKPGGHSQRLTWEQVAAADPDVIVAMPCGFDEAGARDQIETVAHLPEWRSLRAVREGHVFPVDANGCFSRPGPRLMDGVERLLTGFHSGIPPYWSV